MTKPSQSAPIAPGGRDHGSNSDWPTMQAAARILEDFGVAYEARVVSAHRTPT